MLLAWSHRLLSDVAERGSSVQLLEYRVAV